MPANITIQSGIAAGTSHRIDNRVARVGSDPQSDVCLPTADIPGHALTLEFRGESCLVYNRCRDRIYVGAQVVEPAQSVNWPETDILQLGQGIELILDFDDAETNHTIDDFEDEHAANELANGPMAESAAHLQNTEGLKNRSNTAKTVAQISVTVLCLVGCIFLLLRDQNRNSSSIEGPGFASVVSSGLENPAVSRKMIQRIQHAEAHRVRGRSKDARKAFQFIRDDLVEETQSSNSDSDNPNSKLLRFVQSRLADAK